MKKKEKGEASVPEGTVDFAERERLPLEDKATLVGHLLLVETWEQRTKTDGGTYYIVRGRDLDDAGRAIAFSTGVALSNQLSRMTGPFRARLKLVPSAIRGRKGYYAFTSP